MRLEQPVRDRVKRPDVNALSQLRLIVDQAPEFGSKRVGQGFRERCEKDAGIRILSCKKHRAMHSNDRLSGSR